MAPFRPLRYFISIAPAIPHRACNSASCVTVHGRSVIANYSEDNPAFCAG